MESVSREIVNSPADWLARDAPFTTTEVAALFDANSLQLRRNPYALSGPANTQRARRSDWKVFKTFCQDRNFLALPAGPAVVAEFIRSMSMPIGPTPARSVATLQRYLSTIAHAHALAELADLTRTAYVKGALKALTRGKPKSKPVQALRWEAISAALGQLNSGSLTWDLRANIEDDVALARRK